MPDSSAPLLADGPVCLALQIEYACGYPHALIGGQPYHHVLRQAPLVVSCASPQIVCIACLTSLTLSLSQRSLRSGSETPGSCISHVLLFSIVCSALTSQGLERLIPQG